MLDRQALFEKFLASLQTAPAPLEYLEGEPEEMTPFDPYQMVAEWTALRHEVKQQGKLLQASQNSLQQAFDLLQSEKEPSKKEQSEKEQSEKEQLQKQPEVRQQPEKSQTEQKVLYRDLLTIVDSLDQACAHWQEQIDALAISAAQSSGQPSGQSSGQPGWQRWLEKLTRSQSTPPPSLSEVLISNQQGVDLIRRSLLDLLRQRQVTPIIAQGKAFNPKTMYAVGRQASTAPENTVIQEVVRGYLWGDQVLREAQVMVSAKIKE
jgi:molecular chaperone GrpE